MDTLETDMILRILIETIDRRFWLRKATADIVHTAKLVYSRPYHVRNQMGDSLPAYLFAVDLTICKIRWGTHCLRTVSTIQ